MNARRTGTLAITLTLLLLLSTVIGAPLAETAWAQSGGPYGLHWNSIDGGGGMFSSGGSFSLGGTIAQPDAGVLLSGGAFTLTGGFWPADQNPTAVTLTYFGGRAQGRDVLLSWATASELDLAGFNVYRALRPGGPYVQLTGALIAAQHPGTPLGAEYTWRDRGLRLGRVYYYRLEQVSVNGETTLHGPVAVRLRSRVQPAR